MIKTVVFDIGKVLLGFEWNDYVHRLFDEETASHVTNAMFGSSSWRELDRAVLSVDEILGLFYDAEPGYRTEIKEAFDRIGECVRRRDWAGPFIDSIKERGYQVLFLSNMSEHVINSNKKAFDFVSHMDGGIFSCHVHEIKPGREIFDKLFEKYGLDAAECIFVDDQADNIAAARRLGMKTVRFYDKERLEADLDKALQKDKGHDKITVLCYGDSNTYGYDPYTGSRYPYEKRWTTLLAEKLGGHYEVIPEGLNGRTTAYDRPGAGWKNGMSSFIACMGTHKPVDIMTIMLGTNDCNAALGLSAEDIAKGMENLVEAVEREAPALQGYVPEIVVVVPAPISEDYSQSPFALELSPESVQNSRDIEPLYRDIADRHMCLFASAASAEVADDCEHLTPRGHEKLAEILCDTIAHK